MLQRLSAEFFRFIRVLRNSQARVASAPMKFPGRFTSGLILLFTSCGALAQSELDVRIKPSNDALKANIEGYIGGVGDRDEEALLRFSRGAEEQARKAAQALGFYQPQIESDVKGGKNPRLILTIDPGEPVHLRDVIIRVDVLAMLVFDHC